MIRVMRLACPHDFSFRYLAKVINHVETLISFDRKLGTRGIIFFVLYIPTLLGPFGLGWNLCLREFLSNKRIWD